MPYTFHVIKSIRNKGLAKFAIGGSAAGLSVRNPDRIRRILSALNASIKPEDMNLPGMFFHGLHTDPKRYSVRVTGNWRITFAWDEGAAYVDLEDYH